MIGFFRESTDYTEVGKDELRTKTRDSTSLSSKLFLTELDSTLKKALLELRMNYKTRSFILCFLKKQILYFYLFLALF